MEVKSSSSFKLRAAFLFQLRHRFFEVLRTPDFRNCNAAHEIRKDMELLMILHKQIMLETNQHAGKLLQGNRRLEPGFVAAKEGQERKKPKLDQLKGFAQRATKSEGSTQPPFESSKKKEAIGRFCVEGSYIVGGSVSGWNFITLEALNQFTMV